MHRWLEDRAGEFVLISIHDDATSRLMMACFVERDDGAENRRAIIAYLRRHGRPLAVYTDHAGHFGQWLAKKGRRTDTIISRALGELDIEVILAGSPQAKGRVERSFGTAQDRLVKEMRVAGITTIRAANRFLAENGVPLWNERGSLRRKREQLAEAVPGLIRDHHRFLLRDLLDTVDNLSGRSLDDRIERATQPFSPVLDILESVPGVQRRSADDRAGQEPAPKRKRRKRRCTAGYSRKTGVRLTWILICRWKSAPRSGLSLAYFGMSAWFVSAGLRRDGPV